MSDIAECSAEPSTVERLRALMAAAPAGPFHWQKSDLTGKDITLKREHWVLGSKSTLKGLGLIFGDNPVLARLIVETLNALPELLDELEKARPFAREVIRAAWNAAIDGGSVQEMAERHELIVRTKYDPAVHGEWSEGEPDDGYFVFADWLKSPETAK